MSIPGHFYRESWHSGLRCWCHDKSDADLRFAGYREPRQARQARQARPERPDFQEPGRAVNRFRAPDCRPDPPDYMAFTGLRCYMFTTAAVYAPDRATADAFADAHQLRGPQAREYHAALS